MIEPEYFSIFEVAFSDELQNEIYDQRWHEINNKKLVNYFITVYYLPTIKEEEKMEYRGVKHCLTVKNSYL